MTFQHRSALSASPASKSELLIAGLSVAMLLLIDWGGLSSLTHDLRRLIRIQGKGRDQHFTGGSCQWENNACVKGKQKSHNRLETSSDHIYTFIHSPAHIIFYSSLLPTASHPHIFCLFFFCEIYIIGHTAKPILNLWYQKTQCFSLFWWSQQGWLNLLGLTVLG